MDLIVEPLPTRCLAVTRVPLGKRRGDCARNSRALAGWLAIAALCGSAGCNHAFGPERMETATITGRVHVGGRSIGKGWIEFMPTGGTTGRLRSAALGPDGTFTATKVPVGAVSLRLPGPPPPPTGDGGMDRFLVHVRRNPFKILEVLPGDNPPLDLDLVQELREQSRRASMMQESGR